MNEVKPKEIYGNIDAPHMVRVANGGGGPTGVIRALADAFLEYKSDRKDFNIGWIQSITKDSLENVKHKRADIGLVYEPELEQEYIKNGFAKHHSYIWRDHFWLVGPKEGFPQLAPLDKEATNLEIQETFAKIAELGKTSVKPIFITRDDASGTVEKELHLWKFAGVTLPTELASKTCWYYRMPASEPRFPADCLKLAREMKCLTLIDRGTFLRDKQAQEGLIVYLKGSDENDDLLLNPCHAVVATSGPMNDLAVEFTDFMASETCQKIIQTFGLADPSNIWKMPFFTPAFRPETQ